MALLEFKTPANPSTAPKFSYCGELCLKTPSSSHFHGQIAGSWSFIMRFRPFALPRPCRNTLPLVLGSPVDNCNDETLFTDICKWWAKHQQALYCPIVITWKLLSTWSSNLWEIKIWVNPFTKQHEEQRVFFLMWFLEKESLEFPPKTVCQLNFVFPSSFHHVSLLSVAIRWSVLSIVSAVPFMEELMRFEVSRGERVYELGC